MRREDNGVAVAPEVIYIVVVREPRAVLREEDTVPAAWEYPQYPGLTDEQLTWLGRS
jgi:hypothetical protein